MKQNLIKGPHSKQFLPVPWTFLYQSYSYFHCLSPMLKCSELRYKYIEVNFVVIGLLILILLP